MFKKLKTLIVSLLLFFPSKQVFSDDIPIIVIAPSKKAQSISTVGTSVVVFDENDIENSNEYFLQDVLNFSSPAKLLLQYKNEIIKTVASFFINLNMGIFYIY